MTAINMFYSNSKSNDAQVLIIDLTDFLINKFDEKDYYVESVDYTSLFSINLMLSFKNTNIITFKDKSKEINSKLSSLYDEEKEVFLKLTSKKELKYSCFDIVFYFLAIYLYSKEDDRENEYKSMISSLYKKYFINSGLITSWPDAPTLDEAERYRGLTFSSSDMLDEGFFRTTTTPTPSSLGVAPIFRRNISYSKKKNTFSNSSSSFDSFKNLFIYQLIIFLFRDDFFKEVSLIKLEAPLRNSEESSSNDTETNIESSLEVQENDDDRVKEENLSNEDVSNLEEV